MKKIPEFVDWLFGLIVLLMFGFVSYYYVFIMWELYHHQEIFIFEYNLTMNRIELWIAIAIVLLLIVALAFHVNKLIRLFVRS